MNQQTALITGGTKGIGKAVAQRLLSEGFDVLLTYGSDIQRANEVKDELASAFPSSRVYILQADISDLTSIDLICDYVSDNGLSIGSVIFNAGLTDRTDFHQINPDEWKHVFDANVHFPVFLLQKLYDQMQPGASVVFTGSLMGIHPHSVSLVYGVTKSTVHALVKNLVKFLAPKGIRVNAVAPGFVDTEWQKTKPAKIKANINAKIALGRFCEPEELTDVYLMLVENKYINGEIITVDGAYSYK
ncbi:MAG: SDR family oxidoreductase [Bacteroidota bacterium]|nr:SDR family oxidoreductase [Bacteroidota bacterium]